jgi:hypothetical protein
MRPESGPDSRSIISGASVDSAWVARTGGALVVVGALPAQAVVHRAPAGGGGVLADVGLAAVVGGRLVRRAWTRYRWDGRPRRRP